MRLTEKIEHYIFQWCIHTARTTQQCERIIEIYSVLFFPLVALLHRSTHRSLCKRTLIFLCGLVAFTTGRFIVSLALLFCSRVFFCFVFFFLFFVLFFCFCFFVVVVVVVLLLLFFFAGRGGVSVLYITVITSLREERAGLCASRAIVCLFCMR